MLLLLWAVLPVLAAAAAFATARQRRRDTGPISYLQVDQETRSSEGIVVLVFRGEMDHSTLSETRNALERAYETGLMRVILVMQKVSFINSVSVSQLLEFQGKLTKAGGRLAVAAPSDNVRLVLDTLGFTGTVLPVAGTLEEAEAAVNE